MTSPPQAVADAGDDRGVRTGARSTLPASIGLVLSLGVIAWAMALPELADWNIHVNSFPPLHAEWDPRVGPGTVPALVVGAVTLGWARRFSTTASWRALLVGAYLLGVAWFVSLATVDGWDGIGVILESDYEYLDAARTIDSWGAVSNLLHEYIDRIPFTHPDNWRPHVAGHPPGALLFFVLLVALGLGGGLAAGWVVILVGATTPLAVLVTLRTLGAEHHARLIAPLLVVGPAAIWMAVSGDAVFAAIAAWGLALLARSATRTTALAVALWGLLAGLVLGYCVMMSYGLTALGLLSLAVLFVARNARPLPWAVLSASAVVGAFAVAGFAWWEAFPVLRERYYDGTARNRPITYWWWGNLAALSVSAGPLVGSSVVTALTRARAALSAAGGRSGGGALAGARDDRDAAEPPCASTRAVVILTLAALLTIVAVDATGMSKAEVERIWLPFVPWLLLGAALLSPRWRAAGLAIQVVGAVVVQHLLFTGW